MAPGPQSPSSGVLRRLIVPAVTTGMMLALTLSLGVWQVHRLAWKQGLLAEIDRGEAAAPIPLGATPSSFSRVTLSGRYLSGTAFYGAEVRSTNTGGAMGAQLLSLMERPGSNPVLVDRGWAPTGFDAAPPDGTVTVEGYVRPPEYPVRFGAADDPVTRRFYALDPAAIGAALGVAHVAPFTLVVLGKQGVVPEPAAALPRPPNDHLSYAITWFGLAGALVVIFGVYAVRVLRPAV